MNLITQTHFDRKHSHHRPFTIGFTKSCGPQPIGEISKKLIARIARGRGVRLDVPLDAETTQRLVDVSELVGWSPAEFLAGLVRANFRQPRGLQLVPLGIGIDDQQFLKEMAEQTGKPVAVLVGDMVFDCITAEREMVNRTARHG